MPRTTDLSTILFPVEVRPIGFQPDGGSGAPSGFEAVDQYKAIVRTDNGTVFSVVTKRYELLHNSRALDLGKRAFQLLFPEASDKDFIVYDVQSTKTGSACHVDLIHESYNTRVWEQETWLPFLRVSNSYNRSRALTFDFGFVRELCSNGLIFRKESIQAKFYHTKGELNVDLKQDAQFQRLKELEAEFSSYMRGLREKKLREELVTALALHLLGLKFDLDAKNRQRREEENNRLAKVANELKKLAHKYVAELGSSAYSALNAATDFATHSSSLAGNLISSAGLQEAIGERMRSLPSNSNEVSQLVQSQLSLLLSA